MWWYDCAVGAQEPDSTAFKASLKEAKRLRDAEERRSLYDLLSLQRGASTSQVKKGCVVALKCALKCDLKCDLKCNFPIINDDFMLNKC